MKLKVAEFGSTISKKAIIESTLNTALLKNILNHLKLIER